MSVVAVFIALGGTGYAAFKLPKNSVGTKQLKNGAVTPTKIRHSALAILKGDKGAKGDTGPAGKDGIAATELVQKVTAEDETESKELSVECPNGPVLSGGYVASSQFVSQNVFRLARSYAVDDKSWLVRAIQDTGKDPWALTVVAVCSR
jgi:hypothetical protein